MAILGGNKGVGSPWPFSGEHRIQVDIMLKCFTAAWHIREKNCGI